MIYAQNAKGNKKIMKPEVLAKFKMAAATILNSRFRLPFHCYLSDLHRILHTGAFNAAVCYTNEKPDEEIKTHTECGGQFGFLETR